MCGRIRRMNKTISPGKKIHVMVGNEIHSMIWGFNKGGIYNARSENIDTTWAKYKENRCTVEVNSFTEKGAEFVGKVRLAGIYNEKHEFALLTMPANEIVKKYHHRMPVIV